MENQDYFPKLNKIYSIYSKTSLLAMALGSYPWDSLIILSFEYKQGRLRDEPTPYKAPGVLQGFQLLGVSGISTTCVLSCLSVETAS